MGKKSSYQLSFAAYPAVRVMVLLMLGVIFAFRYKPPIQPVLQIYSALILLWVISEFILRKRFTTTATRISITSYLIIILFTGVVLAGLNQQKEEAYLLNNSRINLYEWENVNITGTVIEAGYSQSGREVYVVEVKNTQLPDSINWDSKYKMRLYGNNEGKTQLGAAIEAEIRLYEFPERRNPHEFDYGKWLHNQGIVAHGEIVSVNKSELKNNLSWAPFRAAVQENAGKLFKGDNAPIAKALLLGYKEGLNPEVQQQFSRSGLSHIMAVSGLHVGFIVAPFWLIIPFLWSKNYGKWIGLLVLTVLLISYAGLTGFSASVSRASLMAWLLTYGKLFHKVRNSINLTAVAAVILILIEPKQLFDVGFQLSFAAVFIILMIMPEAQRLIPAKFRFNKTGGLITIILVSIVVQAGLFPILIYYFGEFSIAGPIANALVVPVLTFTVPIGLLFSLLSPIYFDLFEYLAIPVAYSLEWISSVAATIGSMDYSYLILESTSISLFAVWFAAILVIASCRIPQIRWKMVVLCLFCLNLLSVETILKKPSYKSLEVTFLDVNQGDAAHIKTPNGKNILIDTGRWSPYSNSGERVLLPYFEYLNIERLDAVILSHPHSDHIGGIFALIENLEIERIIQSDYEYDSELYKNYMNLADKKGISIETPKSGDLIEIDPAVRIFVLAPENNGLRPSNPNNRSLVVKMVYGDQSLMFTGDAEREQEAELVKRYGDFLRSTVYKAGHHGSNTSSSEDFMSHIKPYISIVSLAFHNPFRHPGNEAVYRMNAHGMVNYTSLNGAIILKSNGTNIERVHGRQ